MPEQILYRGKVTRITDDGVYATVPSLGSGMEFGPLENPSITLDEGMSILLGQVEDFNEDLVIVSRLDEGYDPKIGQGGGEGGTGFVIYTHNQSTPSNNWTMEHELGHDPIMIEVMTLSGDIAEGFDVIHTIPGRTTVIGFDIATAGTARLI